jgi:hypothetical protein
MWNRMAHILRPGITAVATTWRAKLCGFAATKRSRISASAASRPASSSVSGIGASSDKAEEATRIGQQDGVDLRIGETAPSYHQHHIRGDLGIAMAAEARQRLLVADFMADHDALQMPVLDQSPGPAHPYRKSKRFQSARICFKRLADVVQGEWSSLVAVVVLTGLLQIARCGPVPRTKPRPCNAPGHGPHDSVAVRPSAAEVAKVLLEHANDPWHRRNIAPGPVHPLHWIGTAGRWRAIDGRADW